MSLDIQYSNQNTHDLKNSSPSNSMSPEEAANYIWGPLLNELASAYNNEIIKLQQEYANDPQMMQKMIQELAKKYETQIHKLQESYNEARTASSPDEIQKAIHKAEIAIQEMGKKVPPEQKEAKDIANEANDIAKETNSEINELIKEIQNLQNAIGNDSNLIEILKEKLNDLKETNPTKAAEINKQIEQAEKNLKELENQALGFKKDLEMLSDYQSQINSLENQINSHYEAISKGENVQENLRKLQEMLQELKDVNKALLSELKPIENSAIAAETTKNKLASLIEKIQKETSTSPNPEPWTKDGQQSYFDMGSFPIWSLMDYSNPDFPNGVIDITKFNNYLNSLFDQMKDAGINQIDLAFGQFGSIDNLLALANWDGKDINDLPEEIRTSNDIFTSLMRDYPYSNNGEISNAFEKFIEMAHSKGIKIDLSIGGEIASALTISKEGETPKGQAEKLVELMDKLGIDAVDFDFENALLVQQNSIEDLRTYFLRLHELLSAEGKTSTLTTMGSIPDWVGHYPGEENPGRPVSGFFQGMFFDDKGNSIFNDMFDGLNLMLYGGTTSYLDIKGSSGWGIENWLDVIGKENANKIHIGFEDGVNYADQSTNQGEAQFNIRTGSSSGEAAAQIFNQIKEALKADGYSSDLGDPFWWPQKDNIHNDRYTPDNSGSIDFKLEIEEDFWKELNQIEGNSGGKLQMSSAQKAGVEMSNKELSNLLLSQRSIGAA